MKAKQVTYSKAPESQNQRALEIRRSWLPDLDEQCSTFSSFYRERISTAIGRKPPPSTHVLHLLLQEEGVKVTSQAEASRSRPDSASEAPVGKEWWNVSCFLHDTRAPSGICDPTETGRRRDVSSAWAHPGSTPETQWHSSSPGIEAAARARLGTQSNIEFPPLAVIWDVLPSLAMPDQQCHQIDARTHW